MLAPAAAVAAMAVTGAGVIPQAASAALQAAGYPPFVVALTAGGMLAMESAGTQHLDALMPPPRGMYWSSVSAAGNARTFVVTASPARDNCVTRFYLLTLSASGKPEALRPMDVPAISGAIDTWTSVAASKNGRMIAYAMVACTAAKTVNSIVLITGRSWREWSLPSQALPTSVALSANGAELGFVDSSAQEQGPPVVEHTGAAWVLPTAARPGSVSGRGREVYDDRNGTAVSIALSADGTTAYVTANAGPGTVLAAYRTSDGAMVRTMATWPVTQLNFAGLTIGGDSLITWDAFRPHVYRVSLATGSVTPFWLYSRDGQPALSIAWLPGTDACMSGARIRCSTRSVSISAICRWSGSPRSSRPLRGRSWQKPAERSSAAAVPHRPARG